MIKFNEVRLTDEARSRIVLLYLGCKLHRIKIGSINILANKVILAGVTGKKLTFNTAHVIYDADELINFVYDYIYDEMKRILYLNYGGLNRLFMKDEEGDRLSSKGLMLKLVNAIFDFDFFDEVDDGDVYIALDETVILHNNAHTTSINHLKQSPNNRHVELVNKAINEY